MTFKYQKSSDSGLMDYKILTLITMVFIHLFFHITCITDSSKRAKTRTRISPHGPATRPTHITLQNGQEDLDENQHAHHEAGETLARVWRRFPGMRELGGKLACSSGPVANKRAQANRVHKFNY